MDDAKLLLLDDVLFLVLLLFFLLLRSFSNAKNDPGRTPSLLFSANRKKGLEVALLLLSFFFLFFFCFFVGLVRNGPRSRTAYSLDEFLDFVGCFNFSSIKRDRGNKDNTEAEDEDCPRFFFLCFRLIYA